jgi:membrane-bound serine protease (ClpP class)
MHRLALRMGALLIAGGSALLPLTAAKADSTSRVVDVVQVKGLIDPSTAAYLKDRIAAAQISDSDEAVIVELDCDGGLVSSMPSLVRQIEDSHVPVVVWVAPRGASAAGAGALLLAAANLSFMADAARLGTPTPVNLNSAPDNPLASSRTAALIHQLSSLRARSATAPIGLLRHGGSMTATDAARSGAVDGVASSLATVLQEMDGRSVTLGGGERRTLETWDQNAHRPSVGFRFEEMGLWSRLLHSVTTPEIAFLLLLGGAFGLVFEIYNPGIGFGAILGIAALFLSFYALNILPTDWLGVLVVIIAVALFVVDVQISGFGIWSAGGIACLIAGGSLIFSGAPSAARLSPWAIVVAVVGSLLFFVSVITAALRVRLRRPITGEEAIVGTTGEAKTDIAPEGTVFTKGTLWRARTMETGIAAGSKVQIKAAEGLVLLVEPLSHEDAPEAGASPATTEAGTPEVTDV